MGWALKRSFPDPLRAPPRPCVAWVPIPPLAPKLGQRSGGEQSLCLSFVNCRKVSASKFTNAAVRRGWEQFTKPQIFWGIRDSRDLWSSHVLGTRSSTTWLVRAPSLNRFSWLIKRKNKLSQTRRFISPHLSVWPVLLESFGSELCYLKSLVGLLLSVKQGFIECNLRM